MTNSQASDHAVGSGGTAAGSQVFLSIEEHLQNFGRNFREYIDWDVLLSCVDFKGISEVVENLRRDLGTASDGRQIPETLDKYYPRPANWSSFLVRATPLHWAVLIGDPAMVHTILQLRKVDVNAGLGGYWQGTALHLAICGANVDIVKDLLGHGATVSIGHKFFDRGGRGGMRSLYKNDVIFKMIFQELPDNAVSFHDASGHTALHWAAMMGATHVVEYLVKLNADLNLPDDEGRTALHLAAINKEKPVVEYLVEQKADINLPDHKGRTPLHHAIRLKDELVAKYLVEHDANVHIKDKYGASPILYSIRMGLMDIFTSILPRVEIVHTQDEDGNNALHYAVLAYDSGMGNIAIVEELRELRVDMNARNRAGYTPFFMAVLGGHVEVVKELLLSKERIRIMEECDGVTPIQIAYDNNFDDIERALMEHDDVSRYVETLYRDRQVYGDTANAILVGAALIASVTFASWLQPPLGYTPYFGWSYANSILAPSRFDFYYVDVQHNELLRVFSVFNCLSFYFAIAIVVFGARSELPESQLFIKETVEKLRLNLLVTSILLVCVVSFVMVAFGVAGCIVLTPRLIFLWYMIDPTIFGGVVCLGSLAFLFIVMFKDDLRSYICCRRSAKFELLELEFGEEDLHWSQLLSFLVHDLLHS